MTRPTHQPRPHLYNRPGLQPKEWLLAVMHDPDTPILTRINAAEKLLKLYPYEHQYVPPLVIRIEGFGTNHFITDDPTPTPGSPPPHGHLQ